MMTLYEKIEKVREYLNACEWDHNAARLKYILSARLMRIHDCEIHVDAEAKICEVRILYKDRDDDGWHVEDTYYLYPRRGVSLERLTLAGLERRCWHRSAWDAPEFLEIIRRAGLDATGKTDNAYLDVLWDAGRILDIKMCRGGRNHGQIRHGRRSQQIHQTVCRQIQCGERVDQY